VNRVIGSEADVVQDERDLLARSRRGDLDAFERLVRAHQDRVYALAYRITGNHEDANDAAQEAFVKAFSALRQFRGDAAFSTWLHRIASNAALDLVRRRPVTPPVEIPTGLPAPDNPEDVAHRHEVQRRIHTALGQLPLEFRVAVVLRDLQGMAYDEIARILHVPIGTVRSRISRAREALRVQLTDLVGSEG
jgi:RNA polymerase sigma-70 factor, ECF subfamily